MIAPIPRPATQEETGLETCRQQGKNKAIRSHGRASAGFGCIFAYATSHITVHSPPSLGGHWTDAKLSRSWYLAQDDWHTHAHHTFLPLVARLRTSKRWVVAVGSIAGRGSNASRRVGRYNQIKVRWLAWDELRRKVV
ncbi:hypothetical protein TgHK011_009628 [Trichoderma gracile]|nr:hypothetical protein TgHK011_009628 [Trichoderma gracile]